MFFSRQTTKALPVLGSVVLVLILANEATPCEVIGFSFATALVLDLEPLEVGLILDNLDKSHDSFGYGANGTRKSHASADSTATLKLKTTYRKIIIFRMQVSRETIK